jgi:hypothetical protein
MKRTFVIFVLLAGVTGMTTAQFVFGVKPGLTMNSGQVGFKMNNLVLLGGLEFLRTTATTDESGTRLNYVYSPLPPYGSYQLAPYSDKTESSANIYVPFIGAKLLLGGQETGKAGAYVTGYIAKPIVSGKSVTNGKEDESTKKLLDNLGVWAFQAGFGGEYFFSESFSIGGEFGLRAFLATYNKEDSQTQTVFDGVTTRSYTTTSKYNLDLGLGITYSTLCLNFYF